MDEQWHRHPVPGSTTGLSRRGRRIAVAILVSPVVFIAASVALWHFTRPAILGMQTMLCREVQARHDEEIVVVDAGQVMPGPGACTDLAEVLAGSGHRVLRIETGLTSPCPALYGEVIDDVLVTHFGDDCWKVPPVSPAVETPFLVLVDLDAIGPASTLEFTHGSTIESCPIPDGLGSLTCTRRPRAAVR